MYSAVTTFLCIYKRVVSDEKYYILFAQRRMLYYCWLILVSIVYGTDK